MRFLLSLLSITLLLSSLPATAADIGPKLDQCRAIASLARRLQCYDNLVDGLGTSGLSTVVADPVRSTGPAQPTTMSPPALSAPQVANDRNVTNQTATRPAKTKVAAEELFGKKEAEVKEVVNRELEIASVDSDFKRSHTSASQPVERVRCLLGQRSSVASER